MTDTIPAVDTAKESDDSPTGYTQHQMTEVREEAKRNRLLAKKLQAQIDANNAQRDKEKAAELAKRGEYKELSEQQAVQIAELAEYKTREEAREVLAQKTNAEFIASVPEDKRWSIPTTLEPLQLQQWIAKNRENVIGQQVRKQPTHAGANGNVRTVEITHNDLITQKRMSGEYHQI